jgi:hypothetical protein
MNITVLYNQIVVARPGIYSNPDVYIIPEGSIIYHSRGWIARIFDANSNQLLIVNDTQSYYTQNTGNMAITTSVYHYSPNNLTIKEIGRKIQYYSNGSDWEHPSNFIQRYDNRTNPFLPMIPLGYLFILPTIIPVDFLVMVFFQKRILFHSPGYWIKISDLPSHTGDCRADLTISV